LERGPFNDRQAEKLNDALYGLDSGQLQWLSGFFTGLGQTSSTLSNTVKNSELVPVNAIAEVSSEKINILFGSHTGNSEALAQKLALQAEQRGIEVEVSDMASFKSRDLKKIKNLAVIVSTHGLGEPPVQAEDLHKYLHGKKAPDLSHINFSVLSLGDSSYVDFCQTGKDFDAILEKLGAKRLSPRQDCDVDYEEEAEIWQKGFLDTVAQPSKEVSVEEIQQNEPSVIQQPKYSRKNLFEATILEKINLNGKGSSK